LPNTCLAHPPINLTSRNLEARVMIADALKAVGSHRSRDMPALQGSPALL